jgi:5-formyltetrahydrofolate cyclo-ligase
VSGADDVGSQKRDLRALVRAARDALPAETREALGARVAERLFSVPGFVDAGTVLAFSSFGSEVPTAPILDRLHRQGRRVALPRVRAEAMEARGYRPGDPMTVARFGALEPVEGERLAPEEFDAVIVPGLAFDRQGFRVGYGGGHFDRFLERVRADALTVGICFAIQLVDRIPTEAHDIAVRWVVTDEEAIRT